VAREPAYGVAEIKAEVRLLKRITGTTLAAVLALVIHAAA
jgi:hypothetical protein